MGRAASRAAIKARAIAAASVSLWPESEINANDFAYPDDHLDGHERETEGEGGGKIAGVPRAEAAAVWPPGPWLWLCPVTGLPSLRPGVGPGAAPSGRQAHHQPPANVKAPAKHPYAGPCVGDRGDPQSRWQQDQQRRGQRETSTGRLAPRMRPRKARTGMDNSSQRGQARSPRIRSEAAGPPIPSTPLTGGHHVEKERDKAEAARCLLTT